MPKQINYQLNEEQLAVVRQAIKRDPRVEVRQRAVALHLLHQGMKPQDVAVTLAVSLGSIHKWHVRWRQGGLDGLANQPKSGAPPKADEAYWQRVEEVVAEEPATFGYTFTVWTAERLIAHMVTDTGIELSASRFQTIMRQRGYVYRRPKHDLGNLQDPSARIAAEQWLDELKKARSPAKSTFSLWTKQR